MTREHLKEQIESLYLRFIFKKVSRETLDLEIAENLGEYLDEHERLTLKTHKIIIYILSATVVVQFILSLIGA